MTGNVGDDADVDWPLGLSGGETGPYVHSW